MRSDVPEFPVPADHPEAIARGLAARASEFRVSAPSAFGMGIVINTSNQMDGSVLWRIQIHPKASNAPARVLNHEGLIEWEPIPSDRDDEFLSRCRFTLTEARALIDRLGLWDATWIQGRGWVSRSRSWVEQEQYVDKRVPGFA